MAVRLNNSVRSAIVAAGLLLAALTGLELWLRSGSLSAGIHRFEGVTRPLQRRLVPSETVHHEFRAGEAFTLPAEGDLPARTVRINSFGCRGSEPEATADLYRVLLLGDDTFFGSEVAENETVATRLKQFLPRTTADQIEIINGAVPGDCPLLAWLRVQHRLSELKPRLIILHVDMSDIADDVRYRSLLKTGGGAPTCSHAFFRMPHRPPNLLQQCVKKSAIAGSLVAGLESRAAVMLPGATDGLSASPLAWISDSPPDMGLAVRNALQPVAELNTLLVKSGAKLLVTTAPVRWQVVATPANAPLSREWQVTGTTPFTSRRPFEVLETFCSEHGLRFCSVEPAFRAVKQPERLFSATAPVPSRYGMALYARELSRYLTENTPSQW